MSSLIFSQRRVFTANTTPPPRPIETPKRRDDETTRRRDDVTKKRRENGSEKDGVSHPTALPRPRIIRLLVQASG